MADWKNAVVRVYKRERHEPGSEYRGSAFMVSDRWLLTCEHVVRGAEAEEILLCDATAWRGGVRQVKEIYCDQKVDVALLELREPTAKADVVPVCTEPVELNGKMLECSGFSSETVDRETLRRECRGLEGKYNLFILQGKAGKGMSGSPAMHQGRLVGILRLQNDNTYVVPVKDFEKLLQEHHVPFNEQMFATSSPIDSDGTKIPQNEFDSVIKKHLKELFDDSCFKDVATRIFELARKAPGSMGIEDLLCSPDVAIESAIGWLNCAVSEVMSTEPMDLLKRNRAQKIFEWLILRTVDPQWAMQHKDLICQKAGTRLEVFMNNRHALGVAVIVARCFERPSRFQYDDASGNLRGEGDLRWTTSTEGGIEPAPNEEVLTRRIYKEVFSKDIIGHVTKEHVEELDRRLKNKLKSGLPYYLPIASDDVDTSSPLRENDFYSFHAKFPFLRLIVLRMPDGSRSALMVNDGDLDDFINIFFNDVIGMKNRACK